MSFLLPMFGSLASGLIGKALHLKEGGVIRIKGKKNSGALAVVHDGEMVVPKKNVARVKKVMKEEKISVPKPKTTKSLDSMKPKPKSKARKTKK